MIFNPTLFAFLQMIPVHADSLLQIIPFFYTLPSTSYGEELGIEKSENMEELTDVTLDGIINSRSSTLFIIEGYAPWCPHCQAFGPIISKAADLISAEFTPQQIQMTRINCDKYKDSCEKIKVNGFPTVYAYYHGTQKSEFEGDRESAIPIQKWVSAAFHKIQEKAIASKPDNSLFSSLYLQEGKRHNALFDLNVHKIENLEDLHNDPWLLYVGEKSKLLETLVSRFNGLCRVGYGKLSDFPVRKKPYFLYFLRIGKQVISIPHDSHVESVDELYTFGLKSLLLSYLFEPSTFESAGYEIEEIKHHFSSIFYPFQNIVEHQYMVLYINLELVKHGDLLIIMQSLSEELDIYDFYPIGISVQRPTQGNRIKFYKTHDPLVAHSYLEAQKTNKITSSENEEVVTFTLCAVKDPYTSNKVQSKCIKDINFNKIREFIGQHKSFDITELTPLNVNDVLGSKESKLLALVDPYLHTKVLDTLQIAIAQGRESKREFKIYFMDCWYFKEYASVLFEIEFKEPMLVVVKNKKYYKPEMTVDLVKDDVKKIYEFTSTLVDKSGFKTFEDMHTVGTSGGISSGALEDENEELINQGGSVPFYGIILVILIVVAVYVKTSSGGQSYGALPTHNKYS